MTEIDFHAHILPGCDHGSDRWKTSRRQLELAAEAGVEMICATSHFYGHHISVDSFLEKRQRCFEELTAHAPENGPRVLLGAEVLAFEGIERLPDLKKLRLLRDGLGRRRFSYFIRVQRGVFLHNVPTA